MIEQLKAVKLNGDQQLKTNKNGPKAKKLLGEELNQVPGVFAFIKICLKLIRKQLFSKNGMFNFVIFAILYYIVVRKRCVSHFLWMLYKRLKRMEQDHLDGARR